MLLPLGGVRIRVLVDYIYPIIHNPILSIQAPIFGFCKGHNGVLPILGVLRMSSALGMGCARTSGRRILHLPPFRAQGLGALGLRLRMV